jgi:hypothetical protein
MGDTASAEPGVDQSEELWDSPISRPDGTVEVNARLVGDLPMRDLLDAWSGMGAFAFGHDAYDAAVMRFLIEGDDETEACHSITARLLEFDGVVLLDVRPGPYVAADDDAEDGAGASLESRLNAFMDRLDPELQRLAFERLLGHFDGTLVV